MQRLTQTLKRCFGNQQQQRRALRFNRSLGSENVALHLLAHSVRLEKRALVCPAPEAQGELVPLVEGVVPATRSVGFLC
jgi:hypothetical protein